MSVIREFSNDFRSFWQLFSNAVESLVRAQFWLNNDMVAFSGVEPREKSQAKDENGDSHPDQVLMIE